MAFLRGNLLFFTNKFMIEGFRHIRHCGLMYTNIPYFPIKDFHFLYKTHRKSVLKSILINTWILQNVLLFRVQTHKHLNHNKMHFNYLWIHTYSQDVLRKQTGRAEMCQCRKEAEQDILITRFIAGQKWQPIICSISHLPLHTLWAISPKSVAQKRTYDNKYMGWQFWYRLADPVPNCSSFTI